MQLLYNREKHIWKSAKPDRVSQLMMGNIHAILFDLLDQGMYICMCCCRNIPFCLIDSVLFFLVTHSLWTGLAVRKDTYQLIALFYW